MEHLKASTSPVPYSSEGWFDPLEAAVRFQVRAFIEAMVEAELLAALGGRDRYERKGAPKGYRNGHRDRQLVGTFGQQRVSLPRARLIDESGGEQEWHSQTIRAYKRVTKQAEALIAQVYLAGTNTRRVRRALASLFGGAVTEKKLAPKKRKKGRRRRIDGKETHDETKQKGHLLEGSERKPQWAAQGHHQP